jgi:uncharacterized membrane protein
MSLYRAFTAVIHSLVTLYAYNEIINAWPGDSDMVSKASLKDKHTDQQLYDSENSSRRLARSLKVEFDSRRTFMERIADRLTTTFGTMMFLVLNIIWFAIWIPVNIGLVPGIKPFDPYPFGFLTMAVSLEAIALAIIVLISQNRASKVDDLRQEVMMQLNILTEEELTKMMSMLTMLLDKQGIDVSDDPELQSMLEPTNVEKIEQALEEEINGVEVVATEKDKVVREIPSH